VDGFGGPAAQIYRYHLVAQFARWALKKGQCHISFLSVSYPVRESMQTAFCSLSTGAFIVRTGFPRINHEPLGPTRRSKSKANFFQINSKRGPTPA